MHGFSGATSIYDIAQDGDGRTLIALYVGDYDPSGLCMSVVDLPQRLERYGGAHVELERVALLPEHLDGLPSFPAADKKKDPRHKWLVENYGDECWELDAMDPNALRACVKAAIAVEIEDESWERYARNNKAEQESLRTFFDSWNGR